MTQQATYQISGSAHELYPTEIHIGIVTLSDNSTIAIPPQYPFEGGWGRVVVENVDLNSTKHLPNRLEIIYLSIVEYKFYGLRIDINPDAMNDLFTTYFAQSSPNLIIGMGPYGKMALWLGDLQKQILLGWILASETSVETSDFLPNIPNMKIEDYCNQYLSNESLAVVQNIPPDLFDQFMDQYSYRYMPLFEKWDEDNSIWVKYSEKETIPVLDSIEEELFDGTYDKLHNGELLKHHTAGKPQNIVINWNENGTNYSANCRFNHDILNTIFTKIYGVHKETNVDLIIHFDSQKNKYQFALYRYGLKLPIILPEDAYQIIVFRNKFEQYRSCNYCSTDNE